VKEQAACQQGGVDFMTLQFLRALPINRTSGHPP
jgi:hypothetical protein